jgi:aminopeptidase S
MWGGHAGVAYDPCYHKATDDVTNVDIEMLAKNTAAVAEAIDRCATGVPLRTRRAANRAAGA